MGTSQHPETLWGVAPIVLVLKRFSYCTFGEMLMSYLKSTTMGLLLSASAFAALPAYAQTFAGPGPVTISYLGQNIPCHLTVAYTTTSVTASTFMTGTGDSSFCPHFTSNLLPWTIGPLSSTGTPGISTAMISGVSISIPPYGTCSGSLTATFSGPSTSPSLIGIHGTLHNGSIPCGISANL